MYDRNVRTADELDRCVRGFGVATGRRRRGKTSARLRDGGGRAVSPAYVKRAIPFVPFAGEEAATPSTNPDRLTLTITLLLSAGRG